MRKILKFIVFTSLIYNSAFSLKVDAGFLDKQGRIANIEGCKAQQYNRPINKDVSKKTLDRYCICYVDRFDDMVTQEEAKYYIENGMFPGSVNAKLWEASKQCAFEILNR